MNSIEYLNILRRFRINFFLICTLLVSPFLMGQDLPENDSNAEYGLVYFLRGKGLVGDPVLLFNELDPLFYSFNITYNTFIDDVRVCKLNQKRYSSHHVSPGEHVFKVQTTGKKGKKKAKSQIIDIQAGETYYILIIHMGYYPAIQEITRNTALAIHKEDKLRRDPKCGDSDYVL